MQITGKFLVGRPIRGRAPVRISSVGDVVLRWLIANKDDVLRWMIVSKDDGLRWAMFLFRWGGGGR